MPDPPASNDGERWIGHQRRIGLTGGIATGKSTVGQLLAERGLPILDADRYAREALAPGSPATLAVLERHGPRVRARTRAGSAEEHPGSSDDTIDRAALGRIVFSDASERRWLEQLLHPLVRARFATELDRLQQAPAVVLMIPLLFEAGLEGLCSEVWVVTCDETQQQRRLIERDGLGADEADARIGSQWPLERKKALADVWIDNRQGLKELQQAVAAALGQEPATAPPDLNPLEA